MPTAQSQQITSFHDPATWCYRHDPDPNPEEAFSDRSKAAANENYWGQTLLIAMIEIIFAGFS